MQLLSNQVTSLVLFDWPVYSNRHVWPMLFRSFAPLGFFFSLSLSLSSVYRVCIWTSLCNMKETGSLCQVEQLPCICLLESGTNGHHALNHKRSSWTSSSPGVRSRAGTGSALCSSPECVTTFRLEKTDIQVQRRGAGKVLVTGGGGYFGFKLGKALAEQGISVILMDLNPPCWEIPDRAVYMQVRPFSFHLL